MVRGSFGDPVYLLGQQKAGEIFDAAMMMEPEGTREIVTVQ